MTPHGMTSCKCSGGPAFPACNEANVNDPMGMTLRDYFAGQALAGEMASQSGDTGEWTNEVPQSILEDRAKFFYRFADAMIAARGES